MLNKWDDLKAYLLEHPQLCCEETANYLTFWCLNLEIEEKSSLAEHIAKQVISMQYILELSKQLDIDPRSCISSFFTRIQKADKVIDMPLEIVTLALHICSILWVLASVHA